MIKAALARKGVLRGIIDKQYRNYKHEEIGYISAFLARAYYKFNEMREASSPGKMTDEIMDKLYEELNLLETNEHWTIAKSNHLEQLYSTKRILTKPLLMKYYPSKGMLRILHKNTRNKELVINRRFEEQSNLKDIIDPDKFPIFSLTETLDFQNEVSLWEYRPEILDKIAKDVGFKLEVKQSTIEHHEAGDGTFLSIKDQIKFPHVQMGTLLGLAPGVIFSSYENQDKIKEQVEEDLTFFQRYDDTVVDFSIKLPYPFTFGYSYTDYKTLLSNRTEVNQPVSFKEVPGHYINPYALANKINHPPPDIPPNVILLDLIIPNHFFTSDFLRFLPNIRFSREESNKRGLKEYFHNDSLHCLGVFSLKDIKDGEELFLDYWDSNYYDIYDIPDWLLRPPPISPYLKKHTFDNDVTIFTRMIDMFLNRYDLPNLQNIEKRVKHDPSLTEDQVKNNYFNKLIQKSGPKK